ncbi:MAG: penicillin acylase family protein [Chloroflexaceae bacterium]|jgi:penicillin amidase|nr:penicillin acylase family protein [Chloroflexaceae bacterium]
MMNVARFGRTLGLTLGAAAGMAGVGALVALRRPLPRTQGRVHVPGLHGRVKVQRDRWGIPHIYAATNQDLFTALGYVHAQDRLWQMELNRRTGSGQLAEIFGPIALSSDRFIRTLGFRRIAHQEVSLLDDETRAITEAYVRGVNEYIATHHNRLPLEFSLLRIQPRMWELTDALVWSKMMALNLSCNWVMELFNARVLAMVGPERSAELMPFYPESGPRTVPGSAEMSPNLGAGALRMAEEAAPFLNNAGGAGSNAWVVGGQRSTSGKPLLADDPHLGLALPLVWYEAHLEGGDFAVAGATFPGIPCVVIGHNARIAWGVTNGMTDVQDLYIERFHPEDPLRYEWQGGWEQAELVREEIYVKGQAEPVVEEVRITRHGPIVDAVNAPLESLIYHQNQEPRTENHQRAETHLAQVQNQSPISNLQSPISNLQSPTGLALRWTALESGGTLLRAGLGLNRARNWQEFRAALGDWVVPAQNFVYADVDGNYGYALGGRLPIRAQGNGKFPVPGWDGTHEWTGYIPNEELPAMFNPPEGLAVTANNRIAADEHPYEKHVVGEWLNGYRAERILQLLHETPRHDAASFARIHSDVLSLPGGELARLMADVPLSDPLERQARELLLAWDGHLTPESVGGSLYEGLRYHLSQRAYAELGDLLTAPAHLGAFGSIPGNAFLNQALPNLLARIAAAPLPERADPWLGEGRTWTSVLQESFALAVADLRRRLGENPQTWRYGRIHKLTLRHPLGSVPALARIFNRGPWPTGGDLDTVNPAYTPRNTAAGPVYNGASYRQICDTSDWNKSRSIIATGQSGHPGSPHYIDMQGPWRRGEYHPMLWSRDQVDQHTVATLTLDGK